MCYYLGLHAAPLPGTLFPQVDCCGSFRPWVNVTSLDCPSLTTFQISQCRLFCHTLLLFFLSIDHFLTFPCLLPVSPSLESKLNRQHFCPSFHFSCWHLECCPAIIGTQQTLAECKGRCVFLHYKLKRNTLDLIFKEKMAATQKKKKEKKKKRKKKKTPENNSMLKNPGLCFKFWQRRHN